MTDEEQTAFDRHLEAATNALTLAVTALVEDQDGDNYDFMRAGKLDVALQILLAEEPKMRAVIRDHYETEEDEA